MKREHILMGTLKQHVQICSILQDKKWLDMKIVGPFFMLSRAFKVQMDFNRWPFGRRDRINCGVA